MDTLTTVQELQEIALELETERAKVQRRIAVQQEALEAIEHKLSTIKETLAIVREHRGLPSPGVEIDEQVRARFAGLTPREMAIEFARLQGNRIVVREAAQVLTNLGLFKDKDNASGNLYTAIGRSIERGENVFYRVRRGEYELVDEGNGEARLEGPTSADSREPVSMVRSPRAAGSTMKGRPRLAVTDPTSADDEEIPLPDEPIGASEDEYFGPEDDLAFDAIAPRVKDSTPPVTPAAHGAAHLNDAWRRSRALRAR